MPRVKKLTGQLALAFDSSERKCRDVARTLGHPAWNEFMEVAAPVLNEQKCPAGCAYMAGAGVDVVVCHLARRHLWEPEDIARWLQERFS